MIPILKIKSPESQWPLDNVEEGIVSKIHEPKILLQLVFLSPQSQANQQESDHNNLDFKPFFLGNSKNHMRFPEKIQRNLSWNQWEGLDPRVFTVFI